jgi:CHAT domain-containing protein/tetratricopeptide (TPR) repeat protein
MNRISFPSIKTSATATIGLLALFSSVASAQKPPESSLTALPRFAILQRALRHADWFNWADATSEFQQAERLFNNENDRRNALYAKTGVLRATMEDHSLTEVQRRLAAILETAKVQRDSELLLFVSIAKADVDGELNALVAREDWQRIEQLAKSQNNQKWANRSLGEQSFSEFLVGNISKGRVLIATALEAAQKTNDVGGQIRYLTGIGAVLDQAHRYEQALEYQTKAADLVRSHPEAGYAFVTNEYRLEALVGLQNFTDAEVLAHSIINEASRRNKRVKEAQALITLARIQQQTKRSDNAIQTLGVAARLTSSGNFTRLSADIQFMLTDLYRERRDNRTAELHLSSGLFISQRTPEIWLMPARLESLADMKTADGRYRDADVLYHRASDIVDTFLGSTTNSQAERSLISVNSEVFMKHFQLCADYLNDVGDAYRGIEEARGRVSLDMLRGAFSTNNAKGAAIDQDLSRLRQQLAQVSSTKKRNELKDAIFDAEQQRWTTDSAANGTGPRAAKIVPLRRVQALLTPDEAILEYVVGEHRIYCLVLTNNSAKIVAVGQRAAVEEKIDAYLAEIANKQAKTQNGRTLYAMLLQHITELGGRSHLILIRDGKLHLLPWDALVDSSNRYLVETKNISYAPSVSSAILLRSKPPIKAAKTLLALGGIPYDQSGFLLASSRGGYSSQKLGNIPGSQDEVRDAAKLLEARHAEVDLQLGEDGTKYAFERSMRERHSIVHLAVHALADTKNPDHAALFLLNDKKNGTDGILESAEVLTLPVRANLVVLSACETAVGRLEGQEGIATLSRAFLLAGARTVVSTLWTIDDTFSRFLMAQFYTGIADGLTASVALRNAKLELLKTFGPQGVPYRWAAYTVEGADNYVVPLGP